MSVKIEEKDSFITVRHGKRFARIKFNSKTRRYKGVYYNLENKKYNYLDLMFLRYVGEIAFEKCKP